MGISPNPKRSSNEALFKISKTASTILRKGRLNFDRNELHKSLRTCAQSSEQLRDLLYETFEEAEIAIIENRLFARKHFPSGKLSDVLFRDIVKISDNELIFFASMFIEEKKIRAILEFNAEKEKNLHYLKL